MKTRAIILGAVALWFGSFTLVAFVKSNNGSRATASTTTAPTPQVAPSDGGNGSINERLIPISPLVERAPVAANKDLIDPNLKDPPNRKVKGPTLSSPELEEKVELQKLAKEGWPALAALPWRGKSIAIYYAGQNGPFFILNVVIRKGSVAQAREAVRRFLKANQDTPRAYQVRFTTPKQVNALTLERERLRLAATHPFLLRLPYRDNTLSVDFVGRKGRLPQLSVRFRGNKAAAKAALERTMRQANDSAGKYAIRYGRGR